MEHIVLEFPAAKPPQGRTLVGVVASGDLEVLIEANASLRTTVTINTSVDGLSKVWEAAIAEPASFLVSLLEERDPNAIGR